MAARGPLIVIAGETASGKTDLAIFLARKFNGEIICADSWTVRKGLDIGTAKPTKKQQKLVKHHLIDVIGTCEDFSAAVFKRLALKVIEDISNRGKLPIMVGGSGLYIDSVIFDYSFLEPGEKKLRDKLNAYSLAELINKAKSLDLDLSNIDQRNKRRIIRLIEAGGKQGTKQSLRKNTLVLGLKPIQPLDERIIKRVEKMLAEGLENEVKQLAKKTGWNCEGMLGVGYREWKNYFEGRQNLEQTKMRIIASTNQLAKKQRTWFRRHKFIQWVSQQRQTVEIVTTFLNKINY